MPDKLFASQTESITRQQDPPYHGVINKDAPQVLGIRLTPTLAKRWLETMMFVREMPSIRSHVVEEAWDWHLVYLNDIFPPWHEQEQGFWSWQEAHIYGNHVRLVALNRATHARCVGTAYIYDVDLELVLEGENGA
jgi:hypothetical protein